MRAKLQIESITVRKGSEQLTFHGVSKSSAYPPDGKDEDNTFALFSPSVALEITITNPELIGKFKPGEKYHVDFTPAT
jgi:hypothetical protein